MSRKKSVLFVTRAADNSHAGFETAVAMARHHEASLSVLILTSDDIALAEAVGYAEFNAMIEQEAQDRADSLLSRLPPDMEKPALQIRTGKLFIETIRAVLAAGHDFVVKSAEPPAGLIDRIFGSDDMHLLRKCPCPIWLLRPDTPITPKRVLVCVAMDEREGADATLNGRLVEAALAAMPKADATEVHILHLWNAPGEYLVRSPRTGLSAKQVEEWIGAIRQKHRSWFEGFVRGYSGRGNVRAKLEKGLPDFRIPEVAKELAAEVVVMGTVGRTGISGLLIGNTAETVLGQIECSVLAMKPAGFETPVRPEP